MAWKSPPTGLASCRMRVSRWCGGWRTRSWGEWGACGGPGGSCPAIRTKKAPSRISRGSAITRCCATATTPASRWPGCCAKGRQDAEDHIKILDQAVAALPPQHRRRLMVTVHCAGASHDLMTHLCKLAARPGHQVIYSVGWELGRPA